MSPAAPSILRSRSNCTVTLVDPSTLTGLVVVSPLSYRIQSQRFYRGWRYYSIICAARNPDELVFWGHAPTLELAEMAAENAVTKLESGLPRTGRVTRVGSALGNEVRSTDRM